MAERPEKVLLIVNDLFFEAKIGEVLRTLGVPWGSAKSEEGIARRLSEMKPALVFIDLGARGVDAARAAGLVRAAVAPGEAPPIVAFASHADSVEVARGRGLGAAEVLAKSGLVRALPDLVRHYAGRLLPDDLRGSGVEKKGEISEGGRS
jgi:DNA-binding NarL/FixJ family response regulator